MNAWNYVHYDDEIGKLEGENLPPDGVWSEWIDCYGHIERARFKYDAIDHFYPHTDFVEEKNIVAWRRCK